MPQRLEDRSLSWLGEIDWSHEKTHQQTILLKGNAMGIGLVIFVGCMVAAIICPVAYFLGLRRRATDQEALHDTVRIMLSGPTTKPPAR